MVSSQVDFIQYLDVPEVRGLNVYDVAAGTALDNAVIINHALLSPGGTYITVPARPMSKRTLSQTVGDRGDRSIVHDVSSTPAYSVMLSKDLMHARQALCAVCNIHAFFHVDLTM
jgi:hypothetical protein